MGINHYPYPKNYLFIIADKIMKAAAFEEHGSADKLKLIEVDQPSYNPNQVLIEVKAFALNRLDIWTREGLPNLDLSFPHIGGSDFSGIIKEIGEDVVGFSPGDRVAVNAGISCRTCSQCKAGEPSLCDDFQIIGEHIWGGAAEYVVVPQENLIKLPDNISFKDAAAISLTGLTSYRMLVTKAKVKPGDTVLVTGAGGGIGTISIQIAKSMGAKVIATTSSKVKIEKAKELGAEKVINYKTSPDWSKIVWSYTNKKGVDIVIDSSGEAVFKDAVRSLAKGGKYVTCGATTGRKGELNLALLFWKQLSILGSTMASHKEFEEMMALFFDKKIHPVIDSVYQLSEIQQAHKRLESPDHIGKIVVEL